MTAHATAHPEPVLIEPDARAARLVGIAVSESVPRRPQADLATALERAWALDSARRGRWRRIIEHAGIDSRAIQCAVDDVIHETTASRMRRYEQQAPMLARGAARAAITSATLDAARITDLIIVSCTGFSAPGVDIELIDALGLAPTVRRTTVGFMGCFGALIGLRTAAGACALAPDAVALVVCVELCSLHVPPDPTDADLVACALFADGAAAALVAGPDAPLSDDSAIGTIERAQSRLIGRSRDAMSWRVGDHGFRMTLGREVPVVLREQIARLREDTTWIVHPGGPGILDAIDTGLALDGRSGIEHARTVLARSGNMSSPSVLAVLDEALRHDVKAPARLVAFGPGLSMEMLDLAPAR